MPEFDFYPGSDLDSTDPPDAAVDVDAPWPTRVSSNPVTQYSSTSPTQGIHDRQLSSPRQAQVIGVRGVAQMQHAGPHRRQLATPLARPAQLPAPSDDFPSTSTARSSTARNPFLPAYREIMGDHASVDNRADTWQLPRLMPLTSEPAPSSPLAHLAPPQKRRSPQPSSDQSPELGQARRTRHGLERAAARRSIFVNEVRRAARSADPDDAEQSRIRDLVLAVLDREE